jgi:methionyl-tRNA formyltransferase
VISKNTQALRIGKKCISHTLTTNKLNPFKRVICMKFEDFIFDADQLSVVLDCKHEVPNFLMNKLYNKSIGVHPSLLPLFKGSSPILNSYINNYYQAGISHIKLADKIDEGAVYYQCSSYYKKKLFVAKNVQKLSYTTTFLIIPHLLRDKVKGSFQRLYNGNYTFIFSKCNRINLREKSEYIFHRLQEFEQSLRFYVKHRSYNIRVVLKNIKNSSFFIKQIGCLRSNRKIIDKKKHILIIQTKNHYILINKINIFI